MRNDTNLLFLWHFHCFIVFSKKGLIFFIHFSLLTMIIISQVMKDKWSLICQEILDFNIYISPYSYITLNYVSNFKANTCLNITFFALLFFFSPLITEEPHFQKG